MFYFLRCLFQSNLFLIATYHYFYVSWEAAGMNQMITAVRNTGATNVVLIGTSFFSFSHTHVLIFSMKLNSYV
jgi:hypothetical protein